MLTTNPIGFNGHNLKYNSASHFSGWRQTRFLESLVLLCCILKLICCYCFPVTPLDELWAIGSSGNLIHRLTKTFQHSHNMQKQSDASISFHSDDFEDEWEVI